MPERQRKARLALVGPAAQALAGQLVAAGFQIADGGGAVIDVSGSPQRIPDVRRRYAPVVGILPEDAEPPAEAQLLDALVRLPHVATDLPHLLRTLIRAAEDRSALQRQADDLSALVDVTGALAAGGDPDRLLAHVVERIAGRLTVERCSLVLIEGRSGAVVASSDDPGAQGRRLDLDNYPEFQEVMQTGKPLLIDDAQAHPLLDPVRERVALQKISALAVVPMCCDGAVAGVLVVRSRTRGGFGHGEIAFLSAVASAAAVALRSAGRIQSERLQRVAAERELSQVRRYEEFFSHVNDGMAVLDEQGRVLTLNPAGCAILGVQTLGAKGLPLAELVAIENAGEASLFWRELERGGRVLSADLRVETRDGRKLTLSVSSGPLQSQQHGQAILSFRDVSESRALEAELRKTKEFLERLIHAAADGIVAADLEGKVLLFNRGAERMTGFSRAELVGKAHVSALYPPGQAQRVMQRLRAARAAGDEFGRMRCELISKTGEVIPVDLSAAVVAEGGRDTATVGVFHDLREEMRRDAELRNTRERLEEAEKTALVSELAGAAAHELNQPLTSVLGFSELLFRRTKENDKGREELAAILREAERMASIVKKIGKITRYETTAYVGSKRIVDLDRASDPPPPPVVIRDKT